jgi:hypothetical protein
VSSEKPVDFDALLHALGAKDAEPPPLMKKLLADLRPDPRAALLSELEAWLAALADDGVRRARAK